MTDDEVLEQLRQGNESRARASAAFMAAYDGAGTEVARCWAAHMVAVMNDSPQEKLRWNMESLRAAEAAAGDPRAPGLLPTVLANIGYSTLLMAQPARARSWYSRAAVSLGAAALPDDRRRGYEAGINSMLAIIDAAGTLGLPDPPLDEAPGIGFPAGSSDEKELLLQWLGYLRGAVLRKVEGIDDEQARWTPDDKLIPLIGILNHLTLVEWRWIDGGFAGEAVSRTDAEFRPDADLRLADAVDRYRRRAAATDSAARAMPLSRLGQGWAQGTDLRFVLLHLINETARHAGHADATRELLDGLTGE